jgi:hypothetical protein
MARPLRRRAVAFVSKAYSHDPHERIEAIGGINSDKTRWNLSQAAAIAAIESGADEFFVATRERPVEVVVALHAGQKYLMTDREKTHRDDLLSLPAG